MPERLESEELHKVRYIYIFIHHNRIESTEQKEQQKSTQKYTYLLPLYSLAEP